jgi:superfamily II DNA or RNA helicase
MSAGVWRYSTLHRGPCQVLEEQTLWSQAVCRIWLPGQEAVVRVPAASLRELEADLDPAVEAGRITWLSSAARVAEVLEGRASTQDGPVLLAPMESKVIPLPHQLRVLGRALAGDRVRYLLADEVGLGKTIEAGLVLRELKLRGRVRRTLVVAPKGLANQWVSEMLTHFNERFQLVLGEDLPTMQRLQGGDHSGYWASTAGLNKLDLARAQNPWQFFDQVIVSLDSVKPLERRRGWSAQRVAEHNRLRFEELITAGWDLVVVDEAHRLGGSTDQVARYKLGRGLAEAAPYLLLLSATPHQGKTDSFHRLVSLLDPEAFPDADSLSRERVAPFVIRTEKRKALDAEGRPLFRPRRTELVPVTWQARHQAQEALYEAVTDYVRHGYNQALQTRCRHFGFLMILMQRLVVSSTRAIRTTLERRLEALQELGSRDTLPPPIEEPSSQTPDELEELRDLDGQELLEEVVAARPVALLPECQHLEALLEAALACEAAGPDAKAEALLEWLYQLQAEEQDPELKLLVFTEFVPTQRMLQEFLEARGLPVVTLNGSMDMDERKRAQDAFRDSVRVLVSTDAGGEGLNLQFAHVVVNYDIPWNPMRLEQRIGRVDRIGQRLPVRALNLVFQDTVEHRVRQVLERKLAVILEEFGVDKTGDVLDSAQAGEIFEEVFTSALMDPGRLETSVEEKMSRFRQEIQEVHEAAVLYQVSDEPDLKAAEHLRSHPLPHWVERMTVGYLRSHGGTATRRRSGWELGWPGGETLSRVVFTAREAEASPASTRLGLETGRLQGLVLNLPQRVACQPVPLVHIRELPAQVRGLWGLFEVRLQASASPSWELRLPLVRKGYLAIFLSLEGKIFLPTARHVWDTLQTAEPQVLSLLGAVPSAQAHERLQAAAEEAGADLFSSLAQQHREALIREEERGLVSFASRRRALERIGLPEVRQYRWNRLEKEETEWRQGLLAARQVVPEVRPLLVLSLTPEPGGELGRG